MRNKPRGRRKEFYEGEKGKKKKGRRKEDGDEKKRQRVGVEVEKKWKREEVKETEKKKSQGRGGAPVREWLNAGRFAPFFVLARHIEGEGRLCEPNPNPSYGTKSLSLRCVCTHPSGCVLVLRGGVVLLGGSVKNDEAEKKKKK